jgi:hypothetical protein
MIGFDSVDFQTIQCIDYSVSKLVKPVDYFSRDGTHYRIPYAQPTDFASIPKVLWGPPLYLIPTGWWSLPCIAHDSAFRNMLLVVLPDGSTKLASLNEQQCNDLLLESMQAIKPNPTAFEKLQMEAIFQGVSIGGGSAFKDDRCFS